MRSFPYTPDSKFSEARVSVTLRQCNFLMLLVLVFVRSFSYTPEASFSEKFLVYSVLMLVSSLWGRWLSLIVRSEFQVYWTLFLLLKFLTLVLVRSFSALRAKAQSSREGPLVPQYQRPNALPLGQTRGSQMHAHTHTAHARTHTLTHTHTLSPSLSL